MRCELFMVCLAPAQPTKARLQETSNDYIEQRKEYKVWPNKSHIHLHNIKCNCFTCFLSIVVSRPVFVASHRGVIQECLVCTARHPAFIIDLPGVWQQYRFSKLKTQNSITCRSSHKHASVYWRFMHQHAKRKHIFQQIPWKKGSITSGFRTADSDRSERHADSSSQFRSEWTMRCELFTVCLEPAQPTKARLQETSSDYIEQRKEYKVWPNKSHIHLHNIKCNCFTCFLSIVVSRPVFVASHRGVIQECLVCTARHPDFIIDLPGVWQQYRFSNLKTLPQACKCVLEIHAPTRQKKNIIFSKSHERNDVSRQDSELQTQIGAKDMQMHLHNSDQSELCDVNSSWSA